VFAFRKSPFAPARTAAWLGFVVSAGVVAGAIQIGVAHPAFGVLLALIVGLALVKRLSDKKRMRRLLTSGNVGLVLEAWQGALKNVPHSETMRPLVVATLLAAHGMIDKARYALQAAQRGRAWEAALEHRLLLETLLDAFDGEPDRALHAASRLAELPIVPASPWMQARISALRAAVLAFARSFAHQAQDDDIAALRQAAGENPLVHWPMRYAAAVAYVDRGLPLEARKLLSDAPNWPEDSVFHHFQRELEAHLPGARL
jgi:hypothetical protein